PGEANPPANPDSFVVTQLPISLRDPAKRGYTLARWDTAPAGNGAPVTAITQANLSSYAGGKDKDSIYLYAQWDTVKYSITYATNGGVNSAANPPQYTVESEDIALDSAVRKGYTFGGWYSALPPADNSYAVDTIRRGSTGDTTLYAKWNIVSYAIAYDLRGGAGIAGNPANPATYTVETPTVALQPIARAGYAFGGWYEKPDPIGAPTDSALVSFIAQGDTGRHALYATWTPNTYVLVFDGMGVSVSPAGTTVAYGNAVGALPDTATSPSLKRLGYAFAGWWHADGGKLYAKDTVYRLTQNIVLHARWDTTTYYLRYNLRQGSGASTRLDSFVVSQLPIAPPSATRPGYAPTRPGYALAGWDTAPSGSGAPVTAITQANLSGYAKGRNSDSIYLYAQWDTVKYSITYVTNGGVNHAQNPPQYTVESANISLRPATRKGYAFEGWYSKPDFASGSKVSAINRGSTGNVTVYARWDTVKYAVAYYNDQGANSYSRRTEYTVESSTYTLPALSKTGYAFGGWYREASLATPVLFIAQGDTGRVDLYARWTADKYLLVFDGAGVSVSPSTKEVTYNAPVGTAPNSPLPAPTRTGYTFSGWYTQPNGAGTPYNNSTVYRLTGNLDLHALWVIDTFTVTFETAPGVLFAAERVTYGNTVSPPANPDSVGHDFGGWYKNGAFDEANRWTFNLDRVTQNVTLSARWDIHRYTVSFDLHGGGSGVEPQTVNHGHTASTPTPAPERKGYNLAGWYDSENFADPAWDFAADLITHDTTLHARWDAISYAITYHGTEGAAHSNDTVYNVTAAVVLSDATKADHKFAGWYNAEENGSRVDSIPQGSAGEVDLWAYWKEYFDVRFYLDSSKSSEIPGSHRIVADGDTVSSPTPAPIKTGHWLKEWQADDDDDDDDGGGARWDFAGMPVAQDVDLFAVWEANLYSVSFNTSGGSEVPPQSVRYNDTVARPVPNPTKDGYAFSLWYHQASDGLTPWDFKDPVTGDMILFATWTTNFYTITYKNLGSLIADNPNPIRYTVTDDDVALKPVVRDTTRFSFVGWFADSIDSSEPVTAIPKGTTGDTTLWARWQNVYRVTFNSVGHELGEYRQYVLDGDTAATVLPVRPGFKFNGWAKSAEFIGADQTGDYWIFNKDRITKDTTLWARWQNNGYTIVFNANGGTLDPNEMSKKVTFDSAVGTLPAPLKTGYRFGGWYANLDYDSTRYVETTKYTVSDNVTLHAGWDTIFYRITYDLKGYDSNPSNPDNPVNHPDNRDSFSVATPTFALTLPDKWKTHYVPVGWYLKSGGVETDEEVEAILQGDAGDKEVYVKWEPQSYYIFFNLLDGSVPEISIYTIESDAVEVEPATRKGYTFEGWYNSSDFGGSAVTSIPAGSHGDVSLYAKWDMLTYPIAYHNMADATNHPANPAGYTVETPTTSLKAPARPGYTFDGWYGNASFTGSAVAFIEHGDTGRVALYARWEMNPNALVFSGNGGVVPSGSITKNVDYGKPVGALPTPTRQGYKFLEWNTAPDRSGTAYTANTVYGQTGCFTLLHAIWEIERYTVTFDSRGGSSVDPPTVSAPYNTRIAKPSPDPARQSYGFDGWYRDTGYLYAWDFSAYQVTQPTTLYARWGAESAAPPLLKGLFINDVHYEPQDDAFTYVIGCDSSYISSVQVHFELPENATITNFPADTVIPAPYALRLDSLITLRDTVSGKEKSYFLSLTKNFVFDSIARVQLYGKLVMLLNSPAANGGFKFVQAEWYSTTFGKLTPSSDKFYYMSPTGEAITDTLYAFLRDSAGTSFMVCPYAPPVVAPSPDEAKIAAYPNPVAPRGVVHLTGYPSLAEELERRYKTFALYSAQGAVVRSGNVAELLKGLAMPTTPGTYFLSLDGPESKTLQIAVGSE
ncbi:MAG: InlB B-repeat-containing protein, partial [Prevotellaceae bacterium]|nr:InlB B-repeat-containing protein [Prevotellaceae bacterium]